MKHDFIVDEGVDKSIVDILLAKNLYVLYIAEESPGISDDYIIQKANEENSIIITSDKDFGELIFHKKSVPGEVFSLDYMV